MNDIEMLVAREAIKETKARYCRLLDTKCWSEWQHVFTPDIEMDVTDDVKDIPGAATLVKGRDVIVEQTRAIIEKGTYMHQVHSPEIEFVSNTEAKVIWAMEDWMIFPENTSAPFKEKKAFGHYYETYQLNEGCWQIAKLRLKRLHNAIIPN